MLSDSKVPGPPDKILHSLVKKSTNSLMTKKKNHYLVVSEFA